MKTRIRQTTELERLKIGEREHFLRLLSLYPEGILSVVSDTWDLWKVLTEILPSIKNEVLARNGKLVIRPDSGDPVDIICGVLINDEESSLKHKDATINQRKGVIELIWDIFGGTINEQGYKVLDQHIGAIYGDSITMERATQICERLKSKGFASTNVVFGIGSYTYQYNTRDTFGFAMKATYGEVDGKGREIFKDPITDDGTKKSKKGLLAVYKNPNLSYSNLIVYDQCNWKEENKGLLKTVFLDGRLIQETTLEQIRSRIK